MKTIDPTSIFDMVLRDQIHLDEILEHGEQTPGLVERLLTLSIVGISVYGLVVGSASAILADKGLFEAITTAVAILLALVGATAICLPSFYFYTQIAGMDATFSVVTAQALRVLATTAVLLLGALPFYATAALAACLDWWFDASLVRILGLVLPFGVGLFGIRALHRSFVRLSERLPQTHGRRGKFLRRLVLCWGAVYTIVAPVALFRLLSALGVGV